MLTASLLALALTAAPTVNCNSAEIARADADLVIAQKLYVEAQRQPQKRMALALVQAALERKRTAMAVCSPTHLRPKRSPFDDKPDPFECKPDPFDYRRDSFGCKPDPYDCKPDPFDAPADDSEIAWMATQQVVAEPMAVLVNVVRP